MKTKRIPELGKCLREERQNRIACAIAGIFTLGTGAFMLGKAYAAANEFISMLPLKETSLVFTFAFTAFATVTLLAIGLPLLFRAMLVGPSIKAMTALAERVEVLEKQIKKESEPPPA
jgi:hypothetical protein